MEKIIFLLLVAVTLFLTPLPGSGEDSLAAFYYGQKIEEITFTGIDGNRVAFPPADAVSICYFMSDHGKNMQALSQVFYLVDRLEVKRKVFIFGPGLEGASGLVELCKSVNAAVVPLEANSGAKQKRFISKGCSKCFSMLIVQNGKVKFFRRGYDYYLFKEVLNNIEENKK